MKKNKINLRALIDRAQEIADRIGEIADVCERENRPRNDSEETEYRSLSGERQLIQMRIQASTDPALRQIPEQNPDMMLREAMLEHRREFTIRLQREVMTTAGAEDTGILAVQQENMLKPLRAGLIWDLVGINLITGQAGTKIRWARHGKAHAQWAGEGERVDDSVINFDKLDTKPQRLAVAIPISREELEGSEGVVESVVREEIPAAIAEAINEMLFTTSANYTTAGGDEKPRAIYGPFVKAAESAVSFAGAVPTRKELLKMKAKVCGAGIQLIAPAWVMTENMKAELEATPIDAGSGRFLCEDDKVLGIPVFVHPAIGDGNVGFGDWSCQAAGFFGPIDIVVDPYTLLRKNATDFVSNPHFATATLYDEAFVLGKAKA